MLAYPQGRHEEYFKNFNANKPIAKYLILSQMNKTMDR